MRQGCIVRPGTSRGGTKGKIAVNTELSKQKNEYCDGSCPYVLTKVLQVTEAPSSRPSDCHRQAAPLQSPRAPVSLCPEPSVGSIPQRRVRFQRRLNNLGRAGAELGQGTEARSTRSLIAARTPNCRSAMRPRSILHAIGRRSTSQGSTAAAHPHIGDTASLPPAWHSRCCAPTPTSPKSPLPRPVRWPGASKKCMRLDHSCRWLPEHVCLRADCWGMKVLRDRAARSAGIRSTRVCARPRQKPEALVARGRCSGKGRLGRQGAAWGRTAAATTLKPQWRATKAQRSGCSGNSPPVTMARWLRRGCGDLRPRQVKTLILTDFDHRLTTKVV
ncbi:hypothetical protein Vafri_1638 [Volvox africanus]|nr:hypothetical protein Vafri_1638 [Volvox africanus]